MSDTGRKTVRRLMPNDSHLIAIRIRVGRVPARFLVKLAKQLSIAAAAAAAIAPLALFTHARGHGLRVARPIITQRSEADRTRASPAAPVTSSLANGKIRKSTDHQLTAQARRERAGNLLVLRVASQHWLSVRKRLRRDARNDCRLARKFAAHGLVSVGHGGTNHAIRFENTNDSTSRARVSFAADCGSNTEGPLHEDIEGRDGRMGEIEERKEDQKHLPGAHNLCQQQNHAAMLKDAIIVSAHLVRFWRIKARVQCIYGRASAASWPFFSSSALRSPAILSRMAWNFVMSS